MVYMRKVNGTIVENNNARINEKCNEKKYRAKNRTRQRLGISEEMPSGQKGTKTATAAPQHWLLT